MALIPEDAPVTVKDLYAWYEIKAQLNKLKAAEHLMRMRLCKSFFPSPVEGTNNYNLALFDPNSNGFVLKLKQGFDRKVDEALLTNLKPQFADKHIPDAVFKYRPELAVKEYRGLTAEQQKFVEQCLTIKPESPQLTVEPTAEKKRELAAAAGVKDE